MSTSFEIGKSETELNIFSFNQIVAVTNDFCEENKLGEGGFGPVYKVVLPVQGNSASKVSNLLDFFSSSLFY